MALSDTDEVHWNYALQKYPILLLLDGWVVSYEQGAAKPDPAIFRATIERHCNGRLPFFYTDYIPVHVETARSLGW